MHHRYRNEAWKIVEAIVQNATVPFGICSVHDGTKAVPDYSSCRQDTWILAETLKYAYLIFSPPGDIKKSFELLLPEHEHLRENGRRAVRMALQRTNRTCHKTVIDVSTDLFPFTIIQSPVTTSLKTLLAPDPVQPIFTESSGWNRMEDNLAAHCLELFSENSQNDLSQFPAVLTTEAHPVPLASQVCFSQLRIL